MSCRLLRGVFGAVVGVLLASGCGPKGRGHQVDRTPAANSGDELGLTADGKRWWIQKTARVLQGGHELTDGAELDSLAGKPYPEVVQHFMDGEAFYDVLADFSLYYLGLKSDKLRLPTPDLAPFDTTIADVPQALDAAMRIKRGDDFFGMFSASTPLPAKPLAKGYDLKTGTLIAESTAYRNQAYGQILDKMAALIADLQDGKAPDQATFCNFNGESWFNVTFELGLPNEITGTFFGEGGVLTPFIQCFTDPFVLREDTLAQLQAARASLTDITAYLRTLEPSVYMPKHVSEYQPLDLARLHAGDQSGMSLTWFWSRLPNSSTNRDRRRASYMLKRFFCDDLTPINVVLPESHAAGRHASDPACQACHYKLDPMAGFFRNYGGFGGDFTGQDTITFDDNATKPLNDYVADWRSDGGTHAWQIAYVRSTTDDSVNDYGDNSSDPGLSDLMAIVKRAPEAKQCLVRRLFEYFVGEQQTVDAGYLEELTKAFTEQAAVSSTAAFKGTISSLLLSKTFRTRDPASEECYDFAAGTVQASRPPCRVAFILQKNCAQCHQGESAKGGLDLTRWVAAPGGGMAFPYRGEGGQQLAASAVFQRISDRLSSGDADLRMPLGRYIEVADRDALFLWLNQMLQQKGP